MSSSVATVASSSAASHRSPSPSSDADMSFGERALSAAGAAVISAVIVNPLDVAKTRLQAQAAGVPYNYDSQHHTEKHKILPDIKHSQLHNYAEQYSPGSVRASEPFQYKGTLDVFVKVTRQEGFSRLWRGTNASLVLAVPTVGIYLPCYDILRNWMEGITAESFPYLTPYVPLVSGSMARTLACIACSPVELARTRMQAFKVHQSGGQPPGMWRTLLGILSKSSNNCFERYKGYRMLWTGAGAQLARDVPFSAICWSTLEPMRRHLHGLVGEEGSAGGVLGVNILAGFVSGGIAAAATCPLDVAKTRRQIEKDPDRVLRTTTRSVLTEVWRNEGVKGLFTGVGPRVARAGPSVAIVVSFYEKSSSIFYIKGTQNLELTCFPSPHNRRTDLFYIQVIVIQ